MVPVTGMKTADPVKRTAENVHLTATGVAVVTNTGAVPREIRSRVEQTSEDAGQADRFVKAENGRNAGMK